MSNEMILGASINLGLDEEMLALCVKNRPATVGLQSQRPGNMKL